MVKEYESAAKALAEYQVEAEQAIAETLETFTKKTGYDAEGFTTEIRTQLDYPGQPRYLITLTDVR